MTTIELHAELEQEALEEREEEGITLPDDNEDLGKEDASEVTEEQTDI